MAARMSAAERAQLADLAKRAKDEDDQDSGLEVWAEKDGHRIKLTGADARRYRAKFGLDDDEEEDGELEGEPAGEPKGKTGYLKRKAA